MLEDVMEKRSEEIFQQLAKEDETLLVSLPYRVGFYISQSDQTGGVQADDAELYTLINILRGFSEDFCKSEFVQKILIETVARKDEWESWNGDLQTVPEECGRALVLLSDVLDEKEAGSLKEILMDIGMAVAMAFRESQPASKSASGGLSGLLKGLMRSLSGRAEESSSPFQHINVSGPERRALESLAKAMDYKL